MVSRTNPAERTLMVVTAIAVVVALSLIVFVLVRGDGDGVHALPTPTARVSGDGVQVRACLEPLLRRPGAERMYMLEVAEEAIDGGAREPAPGSCGAERLAWLRGHR